MLRREMYLSRIRGFYDSDLKWGEVYQIEHNSQKKVL